MARPDADAVVLLAGVGLRRQGTWILRGVDWRVRRGEHWAVLGPNGAGKSTLLSLLTAFAWPSEGRVEVLGARLGEVAVAELRRRIGWVSALVADELATLSATPALDVVLGGLDAAIGLWRPVTARERERALALMDAFGAGACARRPFAALSQGERQRVLVARALISAPDLLVLDEPCSGLDLGAREALIGALEEGYGEAERPTLLYVTHHPEEVPAFVDHALLLAGGRVLALGRKEETLTPAHLRRAYGVDVDVRWEGGRAWVRPLGTGARRLSPLAQAPGEAAP